jgi:hypothetical protein
MTRRIALIPWLAQEPVGPAALRRLMDHAAASPAADPLGEAEQIPGLTYA